MILCKYDCGQEGKFKLKNGGMICSESKNKCPELIRKNKEGRKKNPRYKRIRCRFCGELFGNNMIKHHEKTCYLNPKNLRLCEICSKPIKDYKNCKTCSHQCGNTLSGKERIYQDDELSYRKLCFRYHGERCIICGEKYFVHAHHIDGNRENNSPENLVPLCLVHHNYMHSQYKHLIENTVKLYIYYFINGDVT